MNPLFDSLSSENRERRSRVHDICRLYSRSPSKGNLKKLKALFAHYGDEVFIEEGFYCDYADKIHLGDRVYLNARCTLLDGGLITIGDDALIGPNVQILTVNHSLSAIKRLKKENFVSDVIIGNNVWIGAGAIILPGSNIGDNVVVAAGSVVKGELKEAALYAGNPAIYKRTLSEN